jgi:hypothetical protein
MLKIKKLKKNDNNIFTYYILVYIKIYITVYKKR